MNRQIKFRAWDKLNKCMGNVKEIEFYIQVVTYGVAKSSTDDNWTWQPMEISDVHLMQYTGYKDKNGVEIYEGDILQITSTDEDKKNGYNDFTELVYFSFGSFRVTEGEYNILLTTEPEGSFNELGECFDKDCVVIGNMYETPELHNNPPLD
jgi:uncharacterized phage protein (TIGR01671 family)